MSLTTIKTAIATKIAAVTSATPSDEMGILKVLAKKLGLTSTNLVNSANTASDSATGSSDLVDLALWTQAINEYTGNTVIGEARSFAPGMPIDFVDSDGARWLRTGFIESDSTKYDLTKWEYPLAASVFKIENTAQNASYKFSTRVFKLPNGKHVSINYAFRNTIQTFDNPYDTTYTTVHAANSVIGCDYHPEKDILLVLDNTGVIYVGRNNCTSWSTISTATIGTTTGASVHWIGNDIFVCGQNVIRRSTDEGVNWTSHSVPNASLWYVGLAYNPITNLLYVMARSYNTKHSSYTNSSTYTLYSCILGGTTWTSRSTAGGGFCTLEGYINNYPLWVFHYNDASSDQTLWIVTVSDLTGNTYSLNVYSANSSVSLTGNLVTVSNKKYVVVNSPVVNSISFLEYALDSLTKSWMVKSNFSKAGNAFLSGNNGQEGMLNNGFVIETNFYWPAIHTGATNYTFVGGAGNSTAQIVNGQPLYIRIS